MSTLIEIFGDGKELSSLQMCCRGMAMFLLALLLIRISGRRSFGQRAPLDNIIVVLLVAVLSRAVVGASPFIPVTLTCLAIVLLHRLMGWLIARYPTFSRWVEGNKLVLYEDGKFNQDHIKSMQLSQEDVIQGVRKRALTEDMELIDKIYMERNGEVTTIKKHRQ